MGTALADGLYRVTRGGVCAGFIVEGGVIVDCAPVLRARGWARAEYAHRIDWLRVLVTGSREWPRERAVVVRDVIAAEVGDRDPGCVTVVHGACQDRRGRLLGADRWADLTAERLGYRAERYPATPAMWREHGRAAGPLRNRAMVALGADVCLAFPLGASPGTRGCVREAERAGIPVRVTEG